MFNPEMAVVTDSVRLEAELRDTVVRLGDAVQRTAPLVDFFFCNESNRDLLVPDRELWRGIVLDGYCYGLRATLCKEGVEPGEDSWTFYNPDADLTSAPLLLRAGNCSEKYTAAAFDLVRRIGTTTTTTSGDYWLVLQLCSYEWMDTVIPTWIGSACSDTLRFRVTE